MNQLLGSAASSPPQHRLSLRRRLTFAAGQHSRLLISSLSLAVAAALVTNLALIWHDKRPAVLLGMLSIKPPASSQAESLQQDGTEVQEHGNSTEHLQNATQQVSHKFEFSAQAATRQTSSRLQTAAEGLGRSSNSFISPSPQQKKGPVASNTAAAAVASNTGPILVPAPSPAAELGVDLGTSPDAKSKQAGSRGIDPSGKSTSATDNIVVAATKRKKARRNAAAWPAGKERLKGTPVTTLGLPPETLLVSPNNCSQALQAPRVALLFLTRGHLFQEPTWRLWFQSAAELLQADAVRGSACTPDADLEALYSACTAPEGAGILERQHLFSVYIHAPPTFDLPGSPNITDYPKGSLWRGHLISHRLITSWGGFSLVEATRNLLREAYKDPLNQRFLLISESCLPLYDPLTLYSQLLSETKSRVVGCSHGGKDHPRRWNLRMRIPGLMDRSHWRKSSQWFMLLRDHVKIILEDELVLEKFKRWCYYIGWDSHFGVLRDCYPDEHYIPTLLGGVHNRNCSEEMQCHAWASGVSAADWAAGKAHPKSYRPWDVTADLISRARYDATTFIAKQAQERAQALFVNASEVLDPTARKATCTALEHSLLRYYSPLSHVCYLTIRKFPEDTVPAVYALFTNCSSGLRLLSDNVCAAAQPL